MCFILEIEIRQLKNRIAQLEGYLAVAEQRIGEECSSALKLGEVYAQAQEKVKQLEEENGELKLQITEMHAATVSNIDAEMSAQIDEISNGTHIYENDATLAMKMDTFECAAGEIDAPIVWNNHIPGYEEWACISPTSSDVHTRVQEISKHNGKEDERPVVYRCDVCGLRHAEQSNLLQHVQSMHKQLIVTDYQCRHCLKYYAHGARLKIHIETVHKHIKKHQCHKCEKSYGQLYDLQRHIQSKHEGVTFACKHCNKKFSRKQPLRVHVMAHHHIYPHNCEICGMGFTHHTDLIQHRRKHPELAKLVKPNKIKRNV